MKVMLVGVRGLHRRLIIYCGLEELEDYRTQHLTGQRRNLQLRIRLFPNGTQRVSRRVHDMPKDMTLIKLHFDFAVAENHADDLEASLASLLSQGDHQSAASNGDEETSLPPNPTEVSVTVTDATQNTKEK
jgi:hypothetical protein